MTGREQDPIDARQLEQPALRTIELAMRRALEADAADHRTLELGLRAAEVLIEHQLIRPPRDWNHPYDRQLRHEQPLERRPDLVVVLPAPQAGQEQLFVHLIEDAAGEYGVPFEFEFMPSDGDSFDIVLHGDRFASIAADDDEVASADLLRHAVVDALPELLTRELVAELLDRARRHSPMVVQELVPNMLALGQLRQVLQHLVREQVPITNMSLILNALADNAVYTKDTFALSEHVRTALGRTICARLASSTGELRALMLSPDAERAIQNAIQLNETGQVLMLDPSTSRAIQENLAEAITEASGRLEGSPIVVVPPKIRRHVKTFLARNFSDVTVISYAEIVPGMSIDCLATIDASRPEFPAPLHENAHLADD